MPFSCLISGKIPVGPLAFMEGSLIHTNEFMCALGKEYFIWKTAKGVETGSLLDH